MRTLGFGFRLRNFVERLFCSEQPEQVVVLEIRNLSISRNHFRHRFHTFFLPYLPGEWSNFLLLQDVPKIFHVFFPPSKKGAVSIFPRAGNSPFFPLPPTSSERVLSTPNAPNKCNQISAPPICWMTGVYRGLVPPTCQSPPQGPSWETGRASLPDRPTCQLTVSHLGVGVDCADLAAPAGRAEEYICGEPTTFPPPLAAAAGGAGPGDGGRADHGGRPAGDGAAVGLRGPVGRPPPPLLVGVRRAAPWWGT